MPIGWGIVGFGWVAESYMAPAIRDAGHRLVAISDPDPAAQDRAAALGVAIGVDADALAADPAVEAVYVATPNHLHRPAVEAAARAGKPVLCEKPMAATLADALALANAVRRAGILYGTAFDQRHHPAHRAMRAAVAGGRIGTPTAVRIVYGCWVGRDWADAGGRENWRIDAAKAGGGALIDLAPHGLDLVEFLLGEPIVDVAALLQSRVQDYGPDDGAVLVGRTRSGVLASLHVAYNYPETLPRRRLEVSGSGGLLVAIDTMGQEAGGAVTLTDARTGLASPLPISDAAASPFTNQVAAFADAMRSPGASGFSLERDLHTMRLIDAAYGGAPQTIAAVSSFRGRGSGTRNPCPGTAEAVGSGFRAAPAPE